MRLASHRTPRWDSCTDKLQSRSSSSGSILAQKLAPLAPYPHAPAAVLQRCFKPCSPYKKAILRPRSASHTFHLSSFLSSFILLLLFGHLSFCKLLRLQTSSRIPHSAFPTAQHPPSALSSAHPHSHLGIHPLFIDKIDTSAAPSFPLFAASLRFSGSSAALTHQPFRFCDSYANRFLSAPPSIPANHIMLHHLSPSCYRDPFHFASSSPEKLASQSYVATRPNPYTVKSQNTQYYTSLRSTAQSIPIDPRLSTVTATSKVSAFLQHYSVDSLYTSLEAANRSPRCSSKPQPIADRQHTLLTMVKPKPKPIKPWH